MRRSLSGPCAITLQPSTTSLLAATLGTLMRDQDWDTFGVWVHYPWSGRLVRLLPEDAFVEVRTNRNREKITREETAALRTKTVGIVGLSVGRPRPLRWPWSVDAVP